jgi:hypothetical protein
MTSDPKLHPGGRVIMALIFLIGSIFKACAGWQPVGCDEQPLQTQILSAFIEPQTVDEIVGVF